MKALEILKAFADRHESAYGFNNIFVASLGDIKEAIEELASIEQRIEEYEQLETKLANKITGFYEQRIAELVDANETQYEIDQTCQKLLMQRIAGLESQLRVGMNANTVLAEQLVELEAPKTCEGCSEYGLNIGNEYNRNYCTKLNRFTHDAFGCVYYEPKDQK